MFDKGFHSFYEDAVDASAAYLENENGKIIARCVIFNQVKDQAGKIWRLAERQYPSGGSNVLKRALVDALIKGGHKTVGAGCSDTCAFVDNDGNSLGDRRVRDKRGRGASRKIPVFGMLKRGDKVYTQIVKNCSKSELMPTKHRENISKQAIEI